MSKETLLDRAVNGTPDAVALAATEDGSERVVELSRVTYELVRRAVELRRKLNQYESFETVLERAQVNGLKNIVQASEKALAWRTAQARGVSLLDLLG